MTIQPSILLKPTAQPVGRSVTTGFAALTLDAADERVAFIFQPPKDGTITGIHYKTGTVSVGSTVTVRMESIALNSFNPSGTLWGANTQGTSVIAATDDGVSKYCALAAGAVVAKSDFVALVIANPTGASVTLAGMDTNRIARQFPRTMTYVSGSWAATTNGAILALEYSDGSVLTPMGAVTPTGALGVPVFNSLSNPKEKGNRFEVSALMRCVGASVYCDLGTGNAEISLYQVVGGPSLVLLANVTVGAPMIQGAGLSQGQVDVLFGTAHTLYPGNVYAIMVKPDINNMTLEETTIFAGLEGAMPLGATGYWIQISSTNVITTNTLKYASIVPIFDGFDDGTGAGSGGGGGGGLMKHPGMNGGLNA